MIGFDETPERLMCSRAGCEAAAGHRIEWSNPRIHLDGRVKVWLACEDHLGYLREFLETRGFPVAVTPVAEEPR